jgi:hypothetical protein
MGEAMKAPNITLASFATRDGSTGLTTANTGHGSVAAVSVSIFQQGIDQPGLLVDFGGQVQARI